MGEWNPKRRSWPRRFADAFSGIAHGVRGHATFRVHISAAVAVLLLAAWLRLPPAEWAILVLCIGMVFSAELLNSSLETLARRVTDQQDAQIARALDIASGAVLTASLAAALGGLILFGKHVAERLLG